MADGIAIVVDVNATIPLIVSCGGCNDHLLLADVITKYVMAKVIAMFGRWNGHFVL